MKLQWTCFDEKGNVDERTGFDADRSAYVLNIDYFNENHDLREAEVSLVTPEKGVVASNINHQGREIVSYSDIANVQMKCYNDKVVSVAVNVLVYFENYFSII